MSTTKRTVRRRSTGKGMTVAEAGRRGATALNASRTPQERSEFARRAVSARLDGMTKEERRDMMRPAHAKRWGRSRAKVRAATETVKAQAPAAVAASAPLPQNAHPSEA